VQKEFPSVQGSTEVARKAERHLSNGRKKRGTVMLIGKGGKKGELFPFVETTVGGNQSNLFGWREKRRRRRKLEKLKRRDRARLSRPRVGRKKDRRAGQCEESDVLAREAVLSSGKKKATKIDREKKNDWMKEEYSFSQRGAARKRTWQRSV